MNMKRINLGIKGMHCQSCSMLITDSLKEQEGIIDVNISHSKGVAAIAYDEKKVSLEQIKVIIRKEGYGVE